MRIGKILVGCNILLSLTPGLSTPTSGIDIAIKIILSIVGKISPKTISSNNYWRHLKQKSYTDCIFLLVPFVGNFKYAKTLISTQNKKLNDPTNKKLMEVQLRSIILKDPFAILRIDTERMTPRLLTDAILLNADVLNHLSDEQKNNPMLMKTALQCSPKRAFENLGKKLRENDGFLAEFISENPIRLRDLKELSVNRQFMLTVMKRDFKPPHTPIMWADETLKNDPRFMLDAFKIRPDVVGHYFTSQQRENASFMLEILKINPTYGVPCLTQALLCNANFMKHAVQLAQKELATYLENNHYSYLILNYLSEYEDSNLLNEIKNVISSNSIYCYLKDHPEAKNNATFIKQSLHISFQITALYLGKQILDNSIIMTAVIKVDPSFIRQAGPTPAGDKSFMRAAFEKNRYDAEKCMSANLKNDIDFMLELADLYGESILENAGKNLKSNRSLMLSLAKSNRPFVVILLKNNPLTDDESFMAGLINIDTRFYEQASSRLRHLPIFMAFFKQRVDETKSMPSSKIKLQHEKISELDELPKS
jgi:hypothetical protein